jgi:hypothetical protein
MHPPLAPKRKPRDDQLTVLATFQVQPGFFQNRRSDPWPAGNKTGQRIQLQVQPG